jgi:hypothetical protein
MVLLTVSHDDFLFLGLELVGFSAHTISRNGKDLNLRRFSDSFYASSPVTIANLFRDIQDAVVLAYDTICAVSLVVLKLRSLFSHENTLVVHAKHEAMLLAIAIEVIHTTNSGTYSWSYQ